MLFRLEWKPQTADMWLEHWFSKCFCHAPQKQKTVHAPTIPAKVEFIFISVTIRATEISQIENHCSREACTSSQFLLQRTNLDLSLPSQSTSSVFNHQPVRDNYSSDQSQKTISNLTLTLTKWYFAGQGYYIDTTSLELVDLSLQ